MAPTGKILLVYNPTAIGPRPMCIFTDINAAFSPLDKADSIPKVIAQEGIVYVDSNLRNLGIWNG